MKGNRLTNLISDDNLVMFCKALHGACESMMAAIQLECKAWSKYGEIQHVHDRGMNVEKELLKVATFRRGGFTKI